MLDGNALRALVVGAGEVALRKARALVEAGAAVRVIGTVVHSGFAHLDSARLLIHERPYQPGDIADALLVIAATGSRSANAAVARDAHALGRLVNVADAPEEGNCTTPAVHRAGDLVIAVGAGGVPAVAARVRDAIAGRFGSSYASAITQLSARRGALLGSAQRERWSQLSADVIGADFCDSVERGTFGERLAAWR